MSSSRLVIASIQMRTAAERLARTYLATAGRVTMENAALTERGKGIVRQSLTLLAETAPAAPSLRDRADIGAVCINSQPPTGKSAAR